jgi:hypothetical protein
VLELAGTTPKRPMVWRGRSARDLRAGQSGNRVSREAGRASCLLDHSRKKDHTGLPGSRFVSPLSAVKRKEIESNRGNQSRAECEGGEMDRGSLSIFIVAIESREWERSGHRQPPGCPAGVERSGIKPSRGSLRVAKEDTGLVGSSLDLRE